MDKKNDHMNLTLHKSTVQVGKWIHGPLIQYGTSHDSLPACSPHHLHISVQPPDEALLNVVVLNLWIVTSFLGVTYQIFYIPDT